MGLDQTVREYNAILPWNPWSAGATRHVQEPSLPRPLPDSRTNISTHWKSPSNGGCSTLNRRGGAFSPFSSARIISRTPRSPIARNEWSPSGQSSQEQAPTSSSMHWTRCIGRHRRMPTHRQGHRRSSQSGHAAEDQPRTQGPGKRRKRLHPPPALQPISFASSMRHMRKQSAIGPPPIPSKIHPTSPPDTSTTSSWCTPLPLNSSEPHIRTIRPTSGSSSTN